jgi:hypothetical protein
MVTNFKLYYIHINNKYIHTIYSYNYITSDMSYVNQPDICLFGPPLTLISPDNRSSTVYLF